MTDKNKYEILAEIQGELKIGKDSRNDFGGYQYRNIEDMLVKIKIALAKHNSVMYFEDDIVNVGGNNYIKSTAHVITPAGEIATSAMAREADSKKGMDAPQLTGAASTYCHKYVAMAVFAIDNGALDPDSMDNRNEGTQVTDPQAKITSAQIKTLEAAAKETGTNIEDVINHFRPGGKIEDFSARAYGEALNILNKKRLRQEQGHDENYR